MIFVSQWRYDNIVYVFIYIVDYLSHCLCFVCALNYPCKVKVAVYFKNAKVTVVRSAGKVSGSHS